MRLKPPPQPSAAAAGEFGRWTAHKMRTYICYLEICVRARIRSILEVVDSARGAYGKSAARKHTIAWPMERVEA